MNAKQVIVIRKDLKMRRGKECAQASHASMAWLTRRLTAKSLTAHHRGYEVVLTPVEEAWVKGAFAKVTLQVNSEDELRDIYQRAKTAGLEAHLIIDSGRTEFDGVPTATAVGIGPDEAEKIDKITGELKLY